MNVFLGLGLRASGLKSRLVWGYFDVVGGGGDGERGEGCLRACRLGLGFRV